MYKAILVLILSIGIVFVADAQINKMNVLFILVDDLKPELGCYGSNVVLSPNIDHLTAKSTVFQNAYCQQAICGPTRASLLTGLIPDKTKIWDLKAKLREQNPDIITLPQFFKQNGYYTVGMGKVFDPSNTDKEGDAKSWSTPFQKTFPLAKGFENIAFGIYQSPQIKAIFKSNGDEGKGEDQFYGVNNNKPIRFSTECLNVPDNAYMDGAMADYAVKQLKTLKKKKQPFFMAVGFKKPHLPFVAPEKYWNLYNRNNIELADFNQKAENSPEIAYHNSGELRNYAADIKSLNEKGNTLQLSEEKQRELIHGYYACISYMDMQVGKLLKALKENGLDKNTIVVLLGDHGWHLGDHSLWCKHSNFEQATRVPLIIKVPGITKGEKHQGFAQFTDVYPTLCELAGLKMDINLDGKSLVPALKNNSTFINSYAISQYPRGTGDGPKEVMGYSIRTKQYRYTEWVKGFTTNLPFAEENVIAVELYDYDADPFETKNVAGDAKMGKVIKEITGQLHTYYTEKFSTSFGYKKFNQN